VKAEGVAGEARQGVVASESLKHVLKQVLLPKPV